MTSPEGPPAPPQKPPEDDLRMIIGVRDVYATLHETDEYDSIKDPYTRRVDAKQHRIQADRVANSKLLTEAEEALRTGGALPDLRAGDLHEYAIPEWMDKDYRPYSVTMASRGNLITRDTTAHSFMSQVPGVNAVVLTPGDLRAGAEWGAMPIFDPDISLQKVKPHLRARFLTLLNIVDDAKARKSNNDLRYAKMLRVRDVLDNIRECRTKAEVNTRLQRLVVKGIDSNEIGQFLEHPSVMAERLTMTMMQRLGSRLKPTFDTFLASVGVDIFDSVDLIARYEHPSDEVDGMPEMKLLGIDVTTSSDKYVIRNKRDLYREKNSMNDRLHDPVTREKLRTVYNIMQYEGADFIQVLDRWRSRRGTTTSSPEFEGLTFSGRQALARSIFGSLSDHHKQPMYSSEQMNSVYTALYGKFDPNQFQFSI